MKKLTKITSVLIIVAILLSMLCISTSAATPTVYNTGTRHVICTSLSTMAKGYYTSGYSYDTLSEKSSSELLSSLRKLMTDTHSYKSSYNDCRDLVKYTDGNNNIVLIYSSVTVTRDDYINDRSNGWNREHVWPKNLGGFGESGAGADLHHVRPSDSQINNTRSNKLYGNVASGSQATGTSLVSGMSGGTYNANYFEPLDNTKGDVARICLYVYARYGDELSKCSSITNVFQSVDVLLEWCELDPVDEWEMGRNDAVYAIQGNRNVFIDYPEYAWLLFDKEVPDDMKTPSGKAINPDSTTEDDNSGNENTGDENTGNENNGNENNGNENNGNENNGNENEVITPETPETNAPETNAPETDAPETDAPENDTDRKDDIIKGDTDDSENDDIDNSNDNDDDANGQGSSDDETLGCGASITVSTLCIVGIVGMAAVIKKKKED